MSDATTAVALAPAISTFAPFVIAVVVPIVGLAATWALTKFAGLCHVNIQGDAIAKLANAAGAEAGALIAAEAGNLANASITVANPKVAAAANRVVASLPSAVKASGLTPDHVATMIAGKIGEWQIAAPSAASTPPARVESASGVIVARKVT